MVQYEDCSSTFRLWYLKFAWVSVRHSTPASLGRIPFGVRPLYMGLINTLLSQDGSRHSCTLPLASGTSTKLLHHSDISSICCFCSHPISSLSGSLSVCIGYSPRGYLVWLAALFHLQYKCAIETPNSCKSIIEFIVSSLFYESACLFVCFSLCWTWNYIACLNWY